MISLDDREVEDAGKEIVGVDGGAGGQGSNSSNPRQFNERVILAGLRRLGEASMADLARYAQLTDKEAGQIVRGLEQQQLIRPFNKHGGDCGQPATLLALNPGGAYSIGIQVGRRSLIALLVDFCGHILERRVMDLQWPMPEDAVVFIMESVDYFSSIVPSADPRKIAGLGIAIPYNMGSWQRELGGTPAAIKAWNHFDVAACLEHETDLPIFIENDGTAAAAAELFHGHGREIDDFLYLFLGAAMGGGVVTEGDYQRGMNGNAGDIGLMPVAPSMLVSAPDREQAYDVLLSRVSVNALFRHLRHHGYDLQALRDLDDLPEKAARPVAEWIEDSADALVAPILSAVRLLDVDTVILDSDLPPTLVDDLIRRTADHLGRASPESRKPPTLRRGGIGAEAAAIGAAILPLHLNFSPH